MSLTYKELLNANRNAHTSTEKWSINTKQCSNSLIKCNLKEQRYICSPSNPNFKNKKNMRLKKKINVKKKLLLTGINLRYKLLNSHLKEYLVPSKFSD